MEEQVLETGEKLNEMNIKTLQWIKKTNSNWIFFSIRFNAPHSMEEDMYKDIRKKFIRKR